MTQRNSITFESVTYLGAETTCGTHPGDGALTRIKIVKGGLLASGFMEAREENPDESQSRYDNPKRTKGLKKGSKWGPLKVQLKSIKTAARLGVAGSLSALSHRVMLKHTFGTEYAAVGCTIGVGSTRTSVVVDSTTGRRAGEIVLVELGSGATAVNKIAAVNDGTHLTMTYPLPSAPDSGGEVRGFYTYAMAAIVSGTPTGAIKLQASNDPETNDTMPGGIPQPAPVNWVDVANSSFTLTSAGETMWNVNAVGYNYVRVVYTDGSGGTSTATVNIIFNGKGV